MNVCGCAHLFAIILNLLTGVPSSLLIDRTMLIFLSVVCVCPPHLGGQFPGHRGEIHKGEVLQVPGAAL